MPGFFMPVKNKGPRMPAISPPKAHATREEAAQCAASSVANLLGLPNRLTGHSCPRRDQRDAAAGAAVAVAVHGALAPRPAVMLSTLLSTSLPWLTFCAFSAACMR